MRCEQSLKVMLLRQPKLFLETSSLLSEVSCENFTHTAIAAHRFGYLQRDIGEIGTHHESCWDFNGIAMGSPCDCTGIESWWD